MTPKVLIIYTGGTIGMIEDPKSGQLLPFDFKHLTQQIPELEQLHLELSTTSFEKPLDSSDMLPEHWKLLAEMIKAGYDEYDGFVILHGSDTMSYTASALSFMLVNLAKPVVLTGSQLPIGTIRTDGKENFITAIEIASAKDEDGPIIQEVCVYFEYQLYRGNRTHKYNAEHFQAFHSANYPVLAEAGVHIKYNKSFLYRGQNGPFGIRTNLDNNVAILKVFPGISSCIVDALLSCKDVKGVILESFGSGNTTTKEWFLDLLRSAIKRGLVIVNVTQCQAGSVEQGRYATSASFNEIGIIGGYDLTTEAAVTKLMFALGQASNRDEVRNIMLSDLRGEMTIPK